MTLVHFTDLDGCDLYVNPDTVTTVAAWTKDGKPATRIRTTDCDNYLVSEKPEPVAFRLAEQVRINRQEKAA